jgi:WD40 repeat protein
MGALAISSESAIVSSSRAPVQSLAFTRDMSLMAVGDTQRNLRIWYRGQVIHDINLSSSYDKVKPTERIRSLAFSPNGDTLYVACGDKIRAYSMTTGEPRWEYQPARSFGFLIISPIALAVSPLGDLAVATDAGKISLWTSEGAMRAHWWDNDSPRHLAFLDEERIVGGDSFSLCTWKMDRSRKVTRRRLAERNYGFAIAPGVGRVCLRSIHSVAIWDMFTDVLVGNYPVPFGPPLVAITPDGKKLFYGGVNEILCSSVDTGEMSYFHVDGASVRSLAMQPDGKAVVAGCSDGSVRYWDIS